ncbi:MAG: GntR family transcriptional regulator [Clostridiales bacterium]|nr:GntR family transcriptional regulator [Clostridiales bacterium]
MFSVDITGRDPIYKQLEQSVVKYISLGLLQPGEQLPSVRALAQELRINPNTVQKAFSSLEQKGLVYTVSGRGVFVSEQSGNLTAIQETAKEKLRRVSGEVRDTGVSLEDQLQIIEEIYKR